MSITLPTQLTLLRIFFIPVMVIFFYWDVPWASFMTALVFGLAGITDWADGYYARKLKLESRFGAFLDPVADKLIVVAALILLVEREANAWMTLAALAIIGRELVISALREWMAQTGQRDKVAVAYIGKLKTTAQIVALICLLYNQDLWFLPLREVGLFTLGVATFLTLYSMMQYLWPVLQNLNNDDHADS
ncbi:MAG: CDP-diacylglycerol--glycerol-3-phosphate 3-phosphatidyltransferase [bacterium]